MWKIKRPRSKLLDDRISGLPDEIIESILSQLTLKEAVKTSLLSRRWKNLWVFTTALSFDVVGYGTKPRKVKSSRIASGVNHALELHQAPTIESIRISFDFKSLYSSVINGWIKFAIEKRVQSLELRDVGRNGVRLKYYTFPRQLLGHANLNFLTAVHLEYLRVTDEVFHDFLLKCPLLERLSVVGSLFVENLIVAGPSLSLKYLNISDCCMLKSIEISAPNLVSFKFIGSGRVSMLLKNVPLLVELFYGTLYSGQSFKIRPFFNYFSELRSLTLDFEVESMQNFTDFPELSNLRNLEFRVLSKSSSRNYDLLGFMSILKACPILCSFKIYLRTTFSISTQMKKTICSRMECPLKCLKEVEFIGFVGGSADVEFAMVLLENASSLEKITISDLGGFRRKCTKDSERQWALDCALNLKLPRGAKLVIV